MKKVKNIFHKIANADPMIWGYVMLNEKLLRNAETFQHSIREIKKPEGDMVNITGKRWRHATAFFIPAPDFLQQFQKSIGKKH